MESVGVEETQSATEPAAEAGREAFVCATCGADVPDGYRFCGQCGRALGETFRPSKEGTVTVVFTDIEGSTALWQEMPEEEAQEMLREHRRIIRDRLGLYSGFEVKGLGDGFMLVFTSARQAIRYAADVQRAFAEYNSTQPERELKVRVGINSGDALREDEDYFGLAVTVAARVAECAHGGQILVSELSRQLVGRVRDIEFVEKGRYQLRGLPGRARLYEVAWEENVAVGVS